MKRAKVTAFLVAAIFFATVSPAFSGEKGKAKNKENMANHGKRGREAGGLPYGLVRHTEKEGELPSGIQKKKDEGELPRGLETGGKRVKGASKVKNGLK
ncbi:MAG TPA: hypothetical protein VNO43_07400 [Candidatus Eisenbacteria bacterium]|nr:hypothetical protein [Candidatus Eisenbacteria bacterium]